MGKRLFILLTLFILNLGAFAQIDLYVVNVRGTVTSADTGEPVPYAHVINPRVHGGTTTNADGVFSIQMLTEDTLVVRSVGFVEEKFWLTEFPPKQMYQVVLKPVRVLINEITVTEDLNMRNRLGLPDPDPLNIPTELRGAAFNEKPPWYAALVSPISFLHYHSSKEEKEKREMRQTIANNEQWVVFSTYHNLANIKRLTGLHGEEADLFMIYCNVNNRLPHYAGQMEIEFQIMDLFFKFKKEQEEKEEK